MQTPVSLLLVNKYAENICRAQFVHWQMGFWEKSCQMFSSKRFSFSLPDPLYTLSYSSYKPYLLWKQLRCAPETILSWVAENLIEGTICCILPKASHGFEVMWTAQGATSLCENKQWERAGRGEMGEVSRQGSSHSTVGCPGYQPALPVQVVSQHWEKVATWWGFFYVVRWHPVMHDWVSRNHCQGQGEKYLAWKETWFSHFSVCKYCDWGCIC